MYFKEYEILKRLETSFLKQFWKFKRRDIFNKIPWHHSWIILWWERWVGKTTLLIQKRIETTDAFYFSADNVLISNIWLFRFVYFLYEEKRIRNLFIDEIFKYPNWIQELKNILDSFPDLKLYCSGSSALELYSWIADLGRRIIDIEIKGFSFREFLNFKYWYNFDSLSFDEILNNHLNLASEILPQIEGFFSKWLEYIKKWIYPFGVDLEDEIFFTKLENTLQRIILQDLSAIKNFDSLTIKHLEKLFYFIANIPPSELTISSLASKIWINKVTLSNVLSLLNKIWVIFLVPKYWNVSDILRKSYKILFSNSNKYYVYNIEPNVWTIRECLFLFFVSFIKKAEVFCGKWNDYYLKFFENTLNFEIWGESKKRKKRKYWKWVYLVLDIDISNDKSIIPLWLLGFLW